ncbi:GerAB/ArcD/ProY family transporter [Alteribacillus iranensis]|uniref:Spore germination protein n=1 Tax=Alteribacillus iranensis TaxID=930128 RepID=A0A1I2EA62_9BACI|nr:endospore germination permease [Alteribacillus iranensis]SFE89368.1 spore germination protein [Alteribacillus iranensis]
MKSFKYGDEKITDKEILIAVPSMIIGVGVLSLPKQITETTTAADGWISILAAGLFTMVMIWLTGKLAASFPNQPFITYTSTLVSRPVAMFLSFSYGVIGICLAALIMRTLTNIAKQYLFTQTPSEMIALAFLLVVVYAVAGSRAGLFRLNMMFFPIIFFITFMVLLFNMRWADPNNFLPVFQSDIRGYLNAATDSVMAYMGATIFLFYVFLVKQPEKTPKMLALGMGFPIAFYLIVFFLCLTVFGNVATSNMVYPVIELAKRVEITGGILERIESLFFVVWIMAVFNSTALAIDTSLLALQPLFKKVSKEKILFTISPIIFFIGMFPEDFKELQDFQSIFGIIATAYSYIMVIVLFIIMKVRGVGGSG